METGGFSGLVCTVSPKQDVRRCGIEKRRRLFSGLAGTVQFEPNSENTTRRPGLLASSFQILSPAPHKTGRAVTRVLPSPGRKARTRSPHCALELKPLPTSKLVLPGGSLQPANCSGPLSVWLNISMAKHMNTRLDSSWTESLTNNCNSTERSHHRSPQPHLHAPKSPRRSL